MNSEMAAKLFEVLERLTTAVQYGAHNPSYRIEKLEESLEDLRDYLSLYYHSDVKSEDKWP